MRVQGELSFINDLRRRFGKVPSPGVRLGMGDDCALLRLRRGWHMAVTTDLLVEGRHFRRDTHVPQSAGHRCLARGLSDLAAMGGAEPLAAFLSLALPPRTLREAGGRRWLEGFLRGFEALAEHSGVVLAGGDTGEAPGDSLVADIVLTGQIRPRATLLRSGARAGDGIWVTGALGGAAAELEEMLAGAAEGRRPSRRRGPASFPEPRLAAGRALGRRAGRVTACLDISDGLSTDLRHLCEESGVAAGIKGTLLPLHPLAARLGGERALQLALHGGEDYELLFTARPEARLPRSLGGVPVTRIGTVLKRARSRPLVTMEMNGKLQVVEGGGWEHLR